ncbi:MAG: 50S ribosomal protein L10 [Bacillota bacterium]
MPKPEKEAVVKELAEKLTRSQALVLTDYRGLNVSALTELRRKLGEANIEFKVVKNTLTIIAARETGMGGLERYLTGPTAIAFAPGDPVAPAKIISEFTRDHKEMEIKGGVLHGKVITADDVRSLATLPSREVMLGRVAAAVAAPVSGLARALAGTIRNLAYALDAVRQQKEGAAAACAS